MSAGMFIGLGIGVWIVLITLVLGIARAAHRGDEMSDREGSDLLEATGVRFHTQLPRPHSTIGGVRSRPPLGRRAAASGVDQQRMIGIALQMLTVVAHHERPDGQGYPYGLSGAAIPRTARVLAIAEVYDVLTAPDSYLCPRTVEEAVEELRRVAGEQLDAELVETFAEMISGRGVGGLRPRGDADLRAELEALRLSPAPA